MGQVLRHRMLNGYISFKSLTNGFLFELLELQLSCPYVEALQRGTRQIPIDVLAAQVNL